MIRVWFFLLALVYSAQAQEILRFEWRDAARNRTVPVKIYLPPQSGARPVLVVSHGLGGSREGLEYLGRAWSKAGYLCVHPQHAGSDETVWRDSATPVLALQRAMKDSKNAIDRAQDVSFVLDQLERQNNLKASPLFRRCDASKIGVAGHSFGAWTALATSGRKGVLGDARVKACVALSAPTQTLAQEKAAFRSYKTPTLFFTGTLDDSPISNTKAAQRRIPFDAVSTAPAYLAILNGADHMTFETRRRKGDGSRDAAHHALIIQATTLFWQAFLNDDKAANQAKSGRQQLEKFGKELGSHGSWEQK